MITQFNPSEAFVVAFCATAVASISLTVTMAAVFAWLRRWTQNVPFLGKLLRCPWCFSHWLAFPLAIALQLRPVESEWLWLDIGIAGFAMVALTAPVTFLISKSG